MNNSLETLSVEAAAVVNCYYGNFDLA